MSPASTASGWGSVKGNTAAGTRQLASLTERSGVVAAGGGPVGAGGGAKDKGGSSAGGSTFADARERERVIATLQNSQDVSEPRAKLKYRRVVCVVCFVFLVCLVFFFVCRVLPAWGVCSDSMRWGCTEIVVRRCD